MKNKSSTLKKMMVVMKNISTLIATVGTLVLILVAVSSILGYFHAGVTVGELLFGSIVVLLVGIMGEDLFGNLLYNLEIKNEA